MSRAVRTARGAFGAGAATLIAAASHALAGGAITWFAIVATALVALPLCVALAGRVGSLWRLALAIAAAQFLYHWSFAGIGAASGGQGGPAPLHAHHLGLGAASGLGSAVSAAAPTIDAAMWIGHALAALATIALLHRGERAFLALIHLVRRAILPALRSPVPVPARVPRVRSEAGSPRLDRLCSPAAITHRGPPATA